MSNENKTKVKAPKQHEVEVWGRKYIVQEIGAFRAFEIQETSIFPGTMDINFAALTKKLIEEMVVSPKINIDEDFRSPNEIKELMVKLYDIAYPDEELFRKPNTK